MRSCEQTVNNTYYSDRFTIPIGLVGFRPSVVVTPLLHVVVDAYPMEVRRSCNELQMSCIGVSRSCIGVSRSCIRRSCAPTEFGATTQGAAKELHFPP